MQSRFSASRVAIALAAVAAVGAGCDAGAEQGRNEFATVYLSAPLSGPNAAEGRDVADGARLALADAGGRAGDLEVRAKVLDAAEGSGQASRWTAARAAANARAATQDSTAIAYVGDFESSATRASLPITNEARMLQVSPASTAVNLVAPFPGSGEVPDVQPSGERTFGRVIPADDVQAQASAQWAERLGANRVVLLSDGSAFGRLAIDVFSSAATSLGVRTADLAERSAISCPVADAAFVAAQPGAHGELIVAAAATAGKRPGGELFATDAILPERLSPGLRRCEPALRVVSGALDPTQLPPAGRDFARRFADEQRRPPGRYAAYGYEAMALVLDAIERAGDRGAERDAVIDAFFETTERRSVLGTYSIDEVGDTTLERVGGYRVAGGRPVPAAELAAP